MQQTSMHLRSPSVPASRFSLPAAPPRVPAARQPRASIVLNSSPQPNVQIKQEGDVQEVRLRLKKPVGLVFAQKPSGGPVYVDEIVPGGEADKTGAVKVGDVLAKCSAVVLKEGKQGVNDQEGYGERTYENFERVEFDATGQDFKTVMSALKSNSARWGILDVTLVLQRPANIVKEQA